MIDEDDIIAYDIDRQGDSIRQQDDYDEYINNEIQAIVHSY